MNTALAWFAKNHVAANLLMVFLLLAGAVTGLNMKVEVFPEFSLDSIVVTTQYPGASPAEVEEAIVRRIEENVAGLAGIKSIDSVAREGSASTTIEVMRGWDLRTLLDEVKAEVDRITTLPDEAEKPLVQEVTRRREVIDLAVYGDVPETTLKNLSERIKNDLATRPGITLVETSGTRTGEIHIEISEKTLRRYGLTLNGVAQLVQEASLDLPAGNVKTNGGEILIRAKGRRYYARDYADIAVITRTDGSKVTLGQIADLSEGFEDVDLITRFKGKPVAVVKVYRVADQNALTVADEVKRYAEELRPSLPRGVDIDLYNDQSTILRSRINLLLKNMAMGLVLVSVLLGLFLNLKLAFWVTLGIPIAFLSGLWLLPEFDVSINMISLFAFILVLGIVVDDAIVIGENIYSKREEGLPPEEASITGAKEVGVPVVFAVLTTVAAFWPLLVGTGTMGKIMRNVPIVVMLVLMGSLIEALFILPAHLSRTKIRTGIRSGKEKLASRYLKRFINGPYDRLVNFCVTWRYATVACGVVMVLLTLGLWQGGWVNFTLFPKVEGDQVACSLTMPSGTPIERTRQLTAYIEKAAEEALEEARTTISKNGAPLYEHTLSLIGLQEAGHGPSAGDGSSGSHLSQVKLQLTDGEARDVSAHEIVALWRKKVGEIPDAEALTFESSMFNAGNAIEVHLSLDDYDQLQAAAEDLKTELRSYPGVFDVGDSWAPGKNEMQLKLKPTARSLGLTLNDLAQQARAAFYGAEALRLQRDQDEVKVLVRYPEKERKSLGYIEEMRIRAPNGSEVPFSQVAEVKMEQGYSTIERSQRQRVIKVTADVDESISNASKARMDLEQGFLPKLKSHYPGLRIVIEGEGKEQKESLDDVLQGFIIALFGIYALLAIPFKSFTQPLVVMAAIPFGMIGAVVGHLIMGMNLSLLSLFGLVGLTGVVVNDSLVLIDAANKLRENGAGVREAVTRAGGMRFRAIILTSLTTFAGLTPMIMEKSLQAQFLIPMAISLGFGVLFATGITLLLIPCGYVILDDAQRIIASLARGRAPDLKTETHTP